MVEDGVEFSVLKGGGCAFASFTFDGDEVSVHAANDVRYTCSAKAISRGHEVVDVKRIKHFPYGCFYF
jgi:hypothetical protein